MTRLLVIALAALALGALAGCGGDDETVVVTVTTGDAAPPPETSAPDKKKSLFGTQPADTGGATTTGGSTTEGATTANSGIPVLRQECAGGDLASCDRLYYETPVGSDDERFGATCGGRSDEELNGRCDEELGSGTSNREACEQGDLAACDRLYFETPVGSDDERFGATCGGRSPVPVNGYCEEVGGDGSNLRPDCAAGDMAACDNLYWISPVDSEDEAFGATCGGRSREKLNGNCEDRLGATAP